MIRSRILRATSTPGIQTFPSAPRLPRPPKNPLLQPIPLYRKILRLHRTLPIELRALGDGYIKSEFHLHSTTENPIHIVGFLSEWQKYAQDLSAQHQGDNGTKAVGAGWSGGKIDKEKIDKMSDEQLAQLYELMKATTSPPTDQVPIVSPGEGNGTDDDGGEMARALIDRITKKEES